MTIAGRFELGQQIGSGGMGTIYRGRDQQTGQQIAVKHLKPEFLASHPGAVERFLREGEVLRQLNHPNIVQIVTVVEEDQQHFLIMEYVEGGSLRDVLRQTSPLPLKRTLEIALDLADALTRTHRLNIIHRDIKPDNVLMAADGTPRLTDFGIARIVDSKVTDDGAILGTLVYLSPEALMGETIDARSDIWSFGIMLFEMLYGQPPFHGQTIPLLVQAILTELLHDLEARRPDLPVALVDLLYRMLAKNPNERIPSVRLVGAEIEALLKNTHYPTPSKPLILAENLPTVQEKRFGTSQSSAQSHNLPGQITEFIGREQEIADLTHLLCDPVIRLVTILATGGMGKTRLSIEVGRALLPQFANGVYFIELAPVSSLDGVLTATALALDFPFQQDTRSHQQQLLDYFQNKQQLLIFDNFEQVLVGAAFIADLLKHAPGIKILVSSREHLNLSYETVFALDGMDNITPDSLTSPAVQLFLQSARRIQPNLIMGEADLPYVLRICQLVQGMPLALILAASWLEMLSLPEIVTEISQSLDFLETTEQDIPTRQRSIRAVFDYSWACLTPQDQGVFMRLGVLRGGMTRAAAQHISGASLRTLQSLINKSLLKRDVVTGRFTLHELLRQYAETHLHATGQYEAAHDQHTAYYAGWLQSQAADLKGKNQLAALDAIEIDFENVRAAWEWAVDQGQAAAIEQMLESLTLFCRFRNRFKEKEVLFQQALTRWAGTMSSLEIQLHLNALPFENPLTVLQKILEAAQQQGNPLLLAQVQHSLGRYLTHQQRNMAEGIPHLDASLAIYRTLDTPFYLAEILDDYAWVYNMLFQQEKRIAFARESLDIRRQIGDQIGAANSLRNLRGALIFVGQFDEGMDDLREANAIARQMRDKLGIAWTSGMLGADLVLIYELEQGMPFLAEASAIAREINEPTVLAIIQYVSAMVLCFRGEILQGKSLAFAELPASVDRANLAIYSFKNGAKAIAAIANEDYELLLDNLMELRKFINGAKSTISTMTPAFVAILCTQLVPLYIHLKYDHEAALLLSFADHHPSQRNKWAKEWGMIQKLHHILETRMEAIAYQAAWEQGKMITATEVVELLLNTPPPQ